MFESMFFKYIQSYRYMHTYVCILYIHMLYSYTHYAEYDHTNNYFKRSKV